MKRKPSTTYAIVSEATLRWTWGSPQKMRLVVDLVRNRRLDKVLAELDSCGRQAAEPIAKLLRSAFANAGPAADPEALYVAEAFVNCGPSFKKRAHYSIRANARVSKMLPMFKRRRQSHVTVKLGTVTG